MQGSTMFCRRLSVSHQQSNFEITKKKIKRTAPSWVLRGQHEQDYSIDLMDGFGINTACLAWEAAR